MITELEKRIISSFILIPLSFFFIYKGNYFFNLFLAFCYVITSIEWFLMSKKNKYHFIGHIFLILSFYSAYILRNNYDDESLFVFLFVIITCIATDIGGYFFGKILKGPKLTRISPNKTYSGAFGGLFLSITFVYLFFNFSYLFYDKSLEFNFETVVFVLMISTISQIGDVIISYFKRLSKIKDTGKIIPGHGGLLDRIDGMIFAFPFSYIIFSKNIII